MEKEKLMKTATFYDLYLDGKVNTKEIYDYIELWKHSTVYIPLHDFLGLSIQEYSKWVVTGKLLS